MSTGFRALRFPELRQRLQAELRGRFSDELDFTSASVLGRLVDIPSLQLAQVYELAEAVAHERSPDAATGGLLNEVAALVGLHRTDRSRVSLLLRGDPGVTVPAGSEVGSVGLNPPVVFATEIPTTLQSMNMAGFRVVVNESLPHCTYTLTVDGVPYTVQTGAAVVSYNVPQLLANALAQAPVEIVSVSGTELVFCALDVNQTPVVSITYAPPRLVDVSVSWVPVGSYTLKINGQDFTIQSNAGIPGQSDPTVLLNQWASQIHAVFPNISGYVWGNLPKILRLFGPSSMTVSRVPNSSASRISLKYPTPTPPQLSPVPVARGVASVNASATQTGPTWAPAESLRQILSPVAGWASARNPQAVFAIGSQENDAAFRRRRLITLKIADASVPEAIRDAILAVEGVARVAIVENCEAQVSGGRPPHSLEVVVQNTAGNVQNDQLIAERLWQVKPAGIATVSLVGTPVTRTVLDSMGFQHALHFSRPLEVAVRVAVLATPHPEEERPANWRALVSAAIADRINALPMGEDVVHARILGEVFSVPGLYDARVFLSRWGSAQPPQEQDLSMSFGEIARVQLPAIQVV